MAECAKLASRLIDLDDSACVLGQPAICELIGEPLPEYRILGDGTVLQGSLPLYHVERVDGKFSRSKIAFELTPNNEIVRQDEDVDGFESAEECAAWFKGLGLDERQFSWYFQSNR